MMFGFERLEVWQGAIEFADLVYSETRALPVAERFRLTRQMRHAAVSVASYVAEGSSKASREEFARFVEFAGGSVDEVVSLCRSARARGYLSQDQFAILCLVAGDQSRMLQGFRRALLSGG